MKSAPSSSWPIAAASSSSPSFASTDFPGIESAYMIQVPAARTYGAPARPRQRSRTSRPRAGPRSPPASITGTDPTSRAQRTPGLGEESRVRLGVAALVVVRVAQPVDPVRAAREGHVAVRVHEPRDDRGTRRIDDLERARVAERALVVRRPDPGDPPVLDEDRDAETQPVGPAVGEGAVPVEAARPVAMTRSRASGRGLRRRRAARSRPGS